MAAHADIKRKDIQDNFIGFLAYSAGMVADYGLKTRGKGAGHAMIRAELDDWTGWSAGVAEFKRFMSKASRCPTTRGAWLGSAGHMCMWCDVMA